MTHTQTHTNISSYIIMVNIVALGINVLQHKANPFQPESNI